MKRRKAPATIGEDEQIARYAYALGNVPETVADRAYAAAFAQLAPADRRQLVDQIRAELPVVPPESASDDPYAFVLLMRNLHARYALVRASGAGSFAAAFVASPPIVAYFTTGTGSVSVDRQPLWVQELAGHETAPIDSGRMHHRRGANMGEWHGG